MALKGLDEDQWATVPPGFSTSILWIFGHALLAKARFGLWLPAPEEPPLLDVLPYEASFERGTSIVNLRTEIFTKSRLIEDSLRIDEKLETLWPQWSQESAAKPLVSPIPMVTNLGESLLFAGSHQLYHAGQIALLRRAIVLK
jgi:hypothetical protein